MLYTDIKEIIIYNEFGGEVNKHYVSELKFGSNYIICKIEEWDFSKNYSFEWKFNTIDDVYNYKNDFLEICKLALDIKPARFDRTCCGFYTIQIIFNDDSIKEEGYSLSFTEDGMEKLKDAILNALPSNCNFYPYCIR